MLPDPDPELIAGLRADLDDARYSVEGLEAAWGTVAAEALGRDDPVPALLALDRRPPAPAGTLGALFVLGAERSVEAVDAALPRTGTVGAERLGLVRVTGGVVTARVDLRPYALADESGVAAWWIASDPGEMALGGELPEEHVLGAGSASTTLAQILVPTGTGRVLDLGTGSGVQGLIAARSAAHVVATDVSSRALGFAGFNAALNHVPLDLREGSLYAPVESERFDRIVSNPPFVITPRGAADVPAYTYRDGGFRGDGLVEAVVRGAAGRLAPGGIAQLLGNWEVRGDQLAARERVLDWAGRLDVWIVERDLLDPAQYAETWVRDGGAQTGTARFRSLVRAWLDDFAERGVTAIGAGYVTLRAPRGAPTLRRFEHLDGPVGSGIGAAIEAGLAAHDLQRVLPDDALADTVLVVGADVTEHRHYWPGDADPTVIELRQGTGFARVRRVDTVTAAVVGASDGELSLGAIVEAVARILDADQEETRAAVLPVVRELWVEGFLALA
ncbi:MAG: methyltransferase [Acidobacteria bacterium]|nr:methyltransferase [Acidobacteriota bacterium]